jgi:hypothetical protein
MQREDWLISATPDDISHPAWIRFQELLSFHCSTPTRRIVKNSGSFEPIVHELRIQPPVVKDL